MPLALVLTTVWDLPPLATKEMYLDRDRIFWFVFVFLQNEAKMAKIWKISCYVHFPPAVGTRLIARWFRSRSCLSHILPE